ncbi:MFS transporter [Halobacteriaceae bacterium SHR40]|uniref:MFS transporter n=1 Tax=Halovenus amylolytica TaxID=2500550 RepID=UPI000FE39192
MTKTERVEEATRSFLHDHPEAEGALEQLVSLDRAAWTFDDAPLDSGLFGELVSTPIVEKTDDGDYRFADREAVEAVVAGVDTGETKTADTDKSDMSISLPEIDFTLAGAIAGVLAIVALVRSLYFSSVFQNGFVVSPANDPYFYRYWQAELLARSSSATDLGMLSTVGELTRLRPLTHALNWWFAALLGGTPDAAATVAAWLPIVASVVLAGVLYGLAVILTDDHRIGLASVLLLALMPVHVVYTALGFLEHRPYQYLWLIIVAFALAWLAVDLQRRLNRSEPRDAAVGHAKSSRAWAMAVLLAVGVAASAHVYGGSPLTFVPVAAYFGFRVVADTRRGIPALPANTPALAGVFVGSLLAMGAHVRWDWHSSVAGTIPVLVALGTIAVAALAMVWHRSELPVAGLLATEGVLAVVGTVLFWQLRPDDVSRLQDRADALFGRETAVETASLFTTDYAIIFGPLAQLGIGFYLALVPLGVITWYVYRQYEPGWLVLVCFAWFYLFLASIQVRFAAQFALFCAIFGAVGFVYVLGAIELVRKPALFDWGEQLSGPAIQLPGTPTRGGYLAGVVVLALVLNLLFVPTLLGQTQYSGDQVEATMAIDSHAEEFDREFPQNFVLSEWGENRMYNYFVNNESRGYGYALSNHESFISGTNPDEQANNFGNRVGYVVLKDRDLPDETVHAQLFDLTTDDEGVARYQLLYATDDIRAFVVVDGATIRATGEQGNTVQATTDVTTSGEQFTHRRSATVDENGVAQIRVAYAGEYEVGNQTVTVTDQQVMNGETVSSE